MVKKGKFRKIKKLLEKNLCCLYPDDGNVLVQNPD
jgi:hypothetical protein